MQRCTDRADALLWPTTARSPRQLQELDELYRSNPLLPFVSRSDRPNEDEIDGEICKLLHNKSAEIRVDEEADVTVRARGTLSSGREPIRRCSRPRCRSRRTWRASSVRRPPRWATRDSSDCTRGSPKSPALAFKVRKRAEARMHHLEENMLGLQVPEVLP